MSARLSGESMTPEPLAIAASVIWIGVLLTVLATARAHSNDRKEPQHELDPADEIELLRYENAVLRAEQQRPLNLGDVRERIRDGMAKVASSGSDEGDDAWATFMEANVLRDTLLTVCRDLETALRNVQRQLSSGVPLPELDRRRGDGRTEPRAAGGSSEPVPGRQAPRPRGAVQARSGATPRGRVHPQVPPRGPDQSLLGSEPGA
jgi:hypothetical protein